MTKRIKEMIGELVSPTRRIVGENKRDRSTSLFRTLRCEICGYEVNTCQVGDAIKRKCYLCKDDWSYTKPIIPDGTEWRAVDGFSGYEISDIGIVRALERAVAGTKGPRIQPPQLLRNNKNYKGYLLCGLSKHGKQTGISVHRLVAKAFIPNPENLPQVNHINGIKTDNRAENLEWCTNERNVAHAKELGLIPKGSKAGLSKLKEADIPIIRDRIAAGEKHTNIAKDYGVHPQQISSIKNKRTWAHIE